jgi:transcriptional regulator with XRE-family HTH domain
MTNSQSDPALSLRIGRRLREARKIEKLSLAKVSERTGEALSKSRISNYEQGLRRMGLEEAMILSRALGNVSPVYLLCLEDSDPLTPVERELVDSYRDADDRGRASILSVARRETSSRADPSAPVA